MEILVEMSNGVITGVYASEQAKVTIIDWDQANSLRIKNEYMDLIEGKKETLIDLKV